MTRRTHRLFQPDGRALICATEHGMIAGPLPGLEHMEKALRQIVAGGVDAVMCSYGVATRFAALLAPVGLILRTDGAGTTMGTMDGPGAQFYTVEDALRLGADAMCVTAFPGTRYEEATLETLARVIRQAHDWGIPVMAEMVPGGFAAGPEMRTLAAIQLSARVAAELGADWVKVPYAHGFEAVIETCFAPVLVLGGAHRPDPQATLTMVARAMQAGASGAVVGRNIWQADEPAAMARALAQIVHGSAPSPILRRSDIPSIA